jgi:hypothetical protein
MSMTRLRPQGVPELISEASDGSARYRYRRFEFTITREGRVWWCHDGISIPLDVSYPELGCFPGMQLAMCHEAGWASRSRGAITRKLCRAVDRKVAAHVRDGVLAGRQPDLRSVQV